MKVQSPKKPQKDSGEMASQAGVVSLQPGGPVNEVPDPANEAGARVQDFLLGIPPTSGKKEGDECEKLVSGEGVTLLGLGSFILQRLLEVFLLRSKTTGLGEELSLFPLPTSSRTLQLTYPDLSSDESSWLCCMTISLNYLGRLLVQREPSFYYATRLSRRTS